jgi:O-antigen/teichoic acid export membrane protein
VKTPLHNRFIRHVAMTGGAQLVQAALAMAAGILVARVLGPSPRGALAVLTALGAITILVGSLGIHLSGVYFLGRFKDERDSIVSNNLVVGSLGGVAVAVGLGALGLALHDAILPGIAESLFIVFLFSVPLLYFNQFGKTLLLGAGRVGIYNVPESVGGVALFLGTIVSIAAFGDRLGPLVALRIVVQITITITVVAFLRSSLRFRFRPSRGLMRRQLNYGVRNYSSSLFWLCLLQSDVVLCNHFLGSHATGIYSVAVSLGLPITLFAGAVGTVIFQRVSAQESRATRVAQTNRTARLILPLVVAAALATALLAHLVVRVVYGSAFDAAATALILLLPGLVAFGLEVVLMNFLAGEGSPPVIVWAPAVGLAVNLGLNLYAIPEWGINGASITSSVAYGVVLVLVLGYYLRSTGSRMKDVLVARVGDVTELTSGRAEPAMQGGAR